MGGGLPRYEEGTCGASATPLTRGGDARSTRVSLGTRRGHAEHARLPALEVAHSTSSSKGAWPLPAPLAAAFAVAPRAARFDLGGIAHGLLHEGCEGSLSQARICASRSASHTVMRACRLQAKRT